MNRNLHTRLLVSLLALLGLGWLALWTYLHFTAADNATADIDARLRRTAASLMVGSAASQASRGPAEAAGDKAADAGNGPAHQTASLPEYELTTLDHRVVTRSPNFPADGPAARAMRTGFSDAVIASERWRFYTLIDRDRGVVCKVAERGTERELRLAALSRSFTDPLLWALPALALLIWLGVWLGLRPLRQISAELATREPHNLDPIGLSLRGAPREVHLLVNALNALLARLKDSLARQRTFTSAVGHELRTPLAGLRAQVQVARRADAAPQKERALAQLEDALARLERLVTNLLRLTRVTPGQIRLQLEQVDLRGLAEHVAATLRDSGRARGIDIALESDPEVPPVAGDAELLASMLGNLLDNAARHSPEGAPVRVTLGRRQGDVELCVIDSGPGIPEAERERVLGDFYRLSSDASSGSGLGLAVVRAVAEAHGGSAELRGAASGGVEARVILPLGALR